MAVLTLAVGSRPGARFLKRNEIPGHWILFVLIDRRCPTNGQVTQDEAQKNWHVQPVAATHSQVMPANNTHAGFRLRRACSNSLFLELRGMWH